MTPLKLRIGSIILALTLPLSTSAYSYLQFIIDPSIRDNVEDQQDETEEDVQEQLWDTQCRDELGIPGGDVLGALRFNLNRCINNRRRVSAKEQSQSRSSVRTNLFLQSRTQTSTRFEGIIRYTRRTLRNQIRLKQSFYKTFPQSSLEQQKSFESVRMQRRVAIQEKEQAIQREEKKRSYYVRDARIAWQGNQATERAQCIKDKIEELKAADEE